MAHILIVCTANICRSPVAEALLRDRLQQRGQGDWVVGSAGTWAHWARGASEYSVEVLRQDGYDITGHRARMIDETLLDEADLVLCMERGHVEALQVEFPRYATKIKLLSEMAGQQTSVHDPYGEPIAMYRQMVDEVTALIDAGLEKIIEMAESNVRGADQPVE